VVFITQQAVSASITWNTGKLSIADLAQSISWLRIQQGYGALALRLPVDAMKKDHRNLGHGTERPVSITNAMPAWSNYPTGQGMGTRYSLGDTPLVIAAATTVNPHQRPFRVAPPRPHPTGAMAISRRSPEHQRTYVNDVPASMCKLKDGDYLRVGNCIYRFLIGATSKRKYHEEIYRLTIIDALTDIHNKRYFVEFLDREWPAPAGRPPPVAGDADSIVSAPSMKPGAPGGASPCASWRRASGQRRKEELFARYARGVCRVLPERPAKARSAWRPPGHGVNQLPFQYEERFTRHDQRRVAMTLAKKA